MEYPTDLDGLPVPAGLRKRVEGAQSHLAAARVYADAITDVEAALAALRDHRNAHALAANADDGLSALAVAPVAGVSDSYLARLARQAGLRVRGRH